MTGARSERAVSILSPFAFLLIWEIVVRGGLLDFRFFPPPSTVLATLWDMIVSGALWKDLGVTLLRVLGGTLLAVIPGLILGVCMGLSRWVRAAINPMVAAVYPIPKTAILPLIMLVFGIGELEKMVVVAIGAFFPVLINTVAGIQNIERVYFEVGQAFKASAWDRMRTIAIPGALPLIFTGLKLAFGMGLIMVFIAEFTGAQSGIGFMMWNAWQVFAVPQMYAGLIIISFLGYIVTVGLDELEHLLVPWRTR